MPSVVVTPETPATTAGPVIGTLQMKRATALGTGFEAIRTEVELANGSTRAYVVGRRLTKSLTWAKLTRAEVDALVTVTAAAFVPYADDPASVPVVMSTGEGLSYDPVAGTFPIRYAATLSLKSRDPVR